MTYAPPRKFKINKNIVPKTMYNSLLLKYHHMENRNRMLLARMKFLMEEYDQLKAERDKAYEYMEEYARVYTQNRTSQINIK